MLCDRYWLLTWTTDGTWPPGDERGFVSNVADAGGRGERFNMPRTPCTADLRPLREYATGKLIGEPVYLTSKHASAIVDQFRETATYRKWTLFAAAVMRNHVHVVVGVLGDPEPETLLRDFKSYASRRLNRMFGVRERWWTESGSARKLPNDDAVTDTIAYVQGQVYPLIVWSRDSTTPDSPFPGERPA
jgi:REP element-mobilizing transposase RayT